MNMYNCMYEDVHVSIIYSKLDVFHVIAAREI
jgi:hypothetical protein